MAETDPCTRCGGSGLEPDPMMQAHDALVMLIAELSGVVTPEKRDELQNAAYDYHQAALRRTRDHQARVTFLEAGLRDIVGQFSEPFGGTHQFLQVPNKDLRNWRAILDGEPGEVNADQAGVKP